MSLNYSHTNAHMAGSICATRPNRSSGRRRPPRWRRCRSATHRPALRSIDQRSKSASDPRTLLAPPPIPAATPAASSALQRAEKRRGGTRPAMHDEGSAGRASAGPVAPSAHDCRRPDDRRRAAADGGAVGTAAAAPPVGGALVVAWAALRRRSTRCEQGERLGVQKDGRGGGGRQSRWARGIGVRGRCRAGCNAIARIVHVRSRGEGGRGGGERGRGREDERTSQAIQSMARLRGQHSSVSCQRAS